MATTVERMGAWLIGPASRAVAWLAAVLFVLTIGVQVGIYEGRKMERKEIGMEMMELAGFTQRDMAVESAAELRDRLSMLSFADDESLATARRLAERTVTAIDAYERGKNGK